MNRAETVKLLAIISANYPNIKIQDPSATATVWEQTLGGYQPEAVLRAARLHMETSPYFPNPAELIKLIPRADLIARAEREALEPPKKRAKVTAIPDGMSEDEFLDKFIEAQVEWEKEIWGDDDNDATAGFLPYEK